MKKEKILKSLNKTESTNIFNNYKSEFTDCVELATGVLVGVRRVHIEIDRPYNTPRSHLNYYFVSEDGKKVFEIHDTDGIKKCRVCKVDVGTMFDGKLQCDSCKYEEDEKLCLEEKIRISKQIIKMLNERIQHYENDKTKTPDRIENLDKTIHETNELIKKWHEEGTCQKQLNHK